jgi:hypothetical protein
VPDILETVHLIRRKRNNFREIESASILRWGKERKNPPVPKTKELLQLQFTGPPLLLSSVQADKPVSEDLWVVFNLTQWAICKISMISIKMKLFFFKNYSLKTVGGV